jgi:hypothetical protein
MLVETNAKGKQGHKSMEYAQILITEKNIRRKYKIETTNVCSIASGYTQSEQAQNIVGNSE